VRGKRRGGKKAKLGWTTRKKREGKRKQRVGWAQLEKEGEKESYIQMHLNLNLKFKFKWKANNKTMQYDMKCAKHIFPYICGRTNLNYTGSSALVLSRKAVRTQLHFKRCNPVVCRVKSQ
jgi:hypothetical protein